MSVTVIEQNEKEIFLIGTAHVSKKSAEEVKEVITRERPDSVCIELCDSRYQSIIDNERWRKMDIIRVLKEKKALLLLANLVMSSFQKKLAKQFNIQPGQEMIEGINTAREIGADIVLADRDIQTTLLRVWHGVGFCGKFRLFLELMISILSNEEISEEELEKLKTEDMLSMALNELSNSFPDLKTYLIDERDKYLAQKIKNAPGRKVVAVLGAGHIPGIKEQILFEQDLKELEKIPPKSKLDKIIGWGIPIIIVGLIVSTFSANSQVGMEQVSSWILWNGSLSALGTFLAWGHPLAILTAFIAAPISSLSPLLAAGWFAGLMEAYIRRPNVEDFESLSDDIYTLKGFWKNRVTHILMVVVLANLGSVFGTFIGGIDVVRLFINTMWG